MKPQQKRLKNGCQCRKRPDPFFLAKDLQIKKKNEHVFVNERMRLNKHSELG